MSWVKTAGAKMAERERERGKGLVCWVFTRCVAGLPSSLSNLPTFLPCGADAVKKLSFYGCCYLNGNLSPAPIFS